MSSAPEPVTEQQHFVPQFYLKQFADAATGEVEILDLELRKIVKPRGPKGICKASFFYALETGAADETSQTVERYLSDRETALAHDLPPIVEKILNNDHIEPDEKLVIAILMSMTYLRGPAMRDWINRASETFMKHFMRIVADTPAFDRHFDRMDHDQGKTTSKELREEVRESFDKGDYDVRFNNADHLKFMGEELKGIANLFHAQYWTVNVSRGAGTFVTTDNPVSVMIPEYRGFYPPPFHARTHYFALTPTIMIEAKFPHQRDGLKLRRRTFFAGDEDKVLMGNRLIAWNARQYVYAQERKFLEDLIPFIKTGDAAVNTKGPGGPKKPGPALR